MIDCPSPLCESEEIVNFLKQDIKLKEVYQKILYQKIIHQTAQERGITITPEEIQEDADCLRREKRLEKASDTLAWLQEQMITPEEWEAGICSRLLAKKLAEALFTTEVEKFFAQNKVNFEQVLLYQIIVPYEPLAQELFYQIEEEEISFYEAAHLYDIDERRRQYCGYEGKLERWRLLPEIAAVVFGVPIGQIINPIKTALGYHLLKVEEFIPAELTPERYQELLYHMFSEWLESELNHLLYNKIS